VRLKAVAICVTFGTVLVACSPAPFKGTDLKRLVLQKPDAPQGTVYVEGSSGYRSLEQYTKDDDHKRIAMTDAGFVTSYFSFFLSPHFYSRTRNGEISSSGSLADSFAMIFKTASGASKGLKIIEEAVRRDGRDLLDRPADGLGEESFGLSGTLQAGYPPGYLYAWTVNNAVFGLIAAGAQGNINENAVRALADRMRAKLG